MDTGTCLINGMPESACSTPAGRVTTTGRCSQACSATAVTEPVGKVGTLEKPPHPWCGPAPRRAVLSVFVVYRLSVGEQLHALIITACTIDTAHALHHLWSFLGHVPLSTAPCLTANTEEPIR